VCHLRCVRSTIQSCSVYISIYTYSHEHNNIAISSNIAWWWPMYRAETCSCILYIATNCNIVVFMTVCIYRYIHTTALYDWRKPCCILSLCDSPASEFYVRTFRNTVCSICIRGVSRKNSSCLHRSVPKRRHIKFRRRGITQKKEYNIQNTAKVRNQERKPFSLHRRKFLNDTWLPEKFKLSALVI